MVVSKAMAVWEGGLRGGRGRYEASSGAFEGAYSYTTRFEGSPGTTPEELIAAAHASCYSMALSAGLEREGKPATRVATTARCTLEKVDAGWRLTKMHLEVRATVAGLDAAAFAAAAEGAKEGCPVSNALKGNLTITLDAKLE